MIEYSEHDVPLVEKCSQEVKPQQLPQNGKFNGTNIQFIRREVEHIKARIHRREVMSHSHYEWKTDPQPTKSIIPNKRTKQLMPLGSNVFNMNNSTNFKRNNNTENSEPVSEFSISQNINPYTFMPQEASTQPNSKRYSKLDKLPGSHSARQKSSSFNVYSQETAKPRKKLKLRPVLDNTQAQEEYKKAITFFHQHYQTLTSLLTNLKAQQIKAIQKSLFQYINKAGKIDYELLDQFIDENDSWLQKELRISRLNQYISVLYVSIQLVTGNLENSLADLINLVGHAAANLIFLAKLYILSRRPDCKHQAGSFESSIALFQQQSYGQQLKNFEEIIIRMKHNNDTISILEIKLGKKYTEFSSRIKLFLKKYYRDNYPPSECFHFMFEYLAYYLHLAGLTDRITFLDVAPHPFLTPETKLQHPYTIVINPEVFIFVKVSKICIRPFTGQFLQFIKDHAELVFWSIRMPEQINPLINMIDLKQYASQKRLYKYHAVSSKGGLLLEKDLNRLGRDVSNVLLIDNHEQAYNCQPSNGITISWKGSDKDRKLLQLTKVLTELFRNTHVLLLIVEYQKITVPQMTTMFSQDLAVLKERPRLIRTKKMQAPQK